MKWTSDDVAMVEKFIDIKNRGYYCNGRELTEVYNRVLQKNVPPTNCGSCIRQRIQELENALNAFKRSLEAESKKNEQPVSTEDNKPTEDKKKVGRPKKK